MVASAVIVPLSSRVKQLSASAYVEYASYVSACAITFAFASLIYAHIVSDFSVVHVVKYSHQLKPLIYKITGVWGNHEGSMLLWSLILSLYTAALARQSWFPREAKQKILLILHLIHVGFLAFILFTSNPMMRITYMDITEGLGLNPLLQDIGLAIHPPTLYIGYVGAAVLFAIMLTALWQKELTQDYIRLLKPFLLCAWSFLTLGIGLGSWWAYRELGWGGFWFWDPVENVSLLPWLSMTAMLHSLLIAEKRESLKGWTICLAILTFAYSILGAFLVRSGVLTSVHAFAQDSARGLFILGLFCVWTTIGCALFVARAQYISNPKPIRYVSREGAILMNNMLLVILSLIVLIGTIYPLILEAFTEHQVTVGTPYYAVSFNSVAVWLLGLAAIAPALKWKEGGISGATKNIIISAMVSLSYAVLIAWFYPDKFWVTYVAMGLALWLISMMVILWGRRVDLPSYNPAIIWQNMMQTPLSYHGMIIAHIGVGIMVLGIAVVTGWQEEKQHVMHEQETFALGNLSITLDKVENSAKHNYITRKGTFTIVDQTQSHIATLVPELRFYPVEQQQTTEAAVKSSPWLDIYAVIGEHNPEQGYAVRVYSKPMVSWIWAGVCLMTLGGLVAWRGCKKHV